MHYYIDGYNLLFRLSRASDQLHEHRQWMIRDLSKKINSIELDATLVFDAQHYRGDTIQKHLKNLEIVFTAAGETADEFILNRLKETKDPSKETVATSDKKLAWLARRGHALTQPIEDFMAWLNRRYQNRLRQVPSKKSLLTNPLAHGKLSTSSLPAETSLSTARPKAGASAEECFKWYLQAFEESYKQMKMDFESEEEDPRPLHALPELGKRCKTKAKRAQNPLISDMDRWLKAFQRRIEGE